MSAGGWEKLLKAYHFFDCYNLWVWEGRDPPAWLRGEVGEEGDNDARSRWLGKDPYPWTDEYRWVPPEG